MKKEKAMCPGGLSRGSILCRNMSIQACHERRGFCSNEDCIDAESVPDLCSGGNTCCISDLIQGDVYWNKLNDYNLTERYGKVYG